MAAGTTGEHAMVGETAHGRSAFATDGPREAVLTEERPSAAQTAAPEDEEYARAQLQTLTRRRKAAEAAAIAAENAAADAAGRASAAIAAAARAAEEAEEAADEAARAADEATEALDAEKRAAAQVKEVAGGAQPPAPRSPSDRPEKPQPPKKKSPPPPPPANPPARHNARETPVDRTPADRPPADRMPADRPPADRTPADPSADDSAPTSRMPAIPPVPPAAPGPQGGRRARRRAQEVAAEANRDPVTEVIPMRPRPEEPTRVVEAGKPGNKWRRWSLPSFGKSGRITPIVLAAGGVGLVIALAVVLTTFIGGGQEPTPAAVVGIAPPATIEASPASATQPAVDPKSKKATAFLSAMRKGGIPVSNSGLPETEAAVVICEQLDQGSKEDTLARSVPAVLPTVTKAQSADVVRLAKLHYC